MEALVDQNIVGMSFAPLTFLFTELWWFLPLTTLCFRSVQNLAFIALEEARQERKTQDRRRTLYRRGNQACYVGEKCWSYRIP